MAKVVLENLSKHFGKVKAVDNVSLEVEDREFLTLLGPSGCGKTTTLRLIAGLEEPTGGNIYIGDTLVNDLSPKERNVAMVFQSYALYPHMTVFDNIGFPLKLSKVPKEQIRQRVKETADLLEIGELLDRKPKELSGGQRQRVALGRAIVRQPTVYLFDEPLSNLDAKLRVYMRGELVRLQRKLGTNLIYVTHDQVEAMSMSDRIAIMNEGRIAQLSTPEHSYSHPHNRWVAGFIGSPPMNFVDCTLVEKDGKKYLETDCFTFPLSSDVGDLLDKAKSSEFVLGVRPEDVSVSKQEKPDLIEAEVYVVEPLGESIIVDIKLGDNILKARTSPGFRADMGDKVYIAFDESRVHIFNKKTEEAIL